VSSTYAWWQRGIVYQVYPRSFADSNGDGVGDLRGIIKRLDYLEWLGVDAVWLSPIFPSPMADFGYDVSDYTAIHPIFGTLRDFDDLVAALHRRGMRILLDFVPNHTSDQHPWFVDARSSRSSPKRDWYLWRDPAPTGGPPNNWLSHFGGSAWEWDETTGQYYYHAFLKEQPDLNWRNPAVQEAMLDALRFWLRRGVDGFRVDVIWQLVKDDLFRDNPPDPDYHPGLPPHRAFQSLYNADRPEVHDVIARMRAALDQYEDRVLIGEIYLPVDRLVTYYGTDGRGAHLPFNFQLLLLPWDPTVIAEAVDRYESLLPPYGWPNWVLGNHDRPRIASRVGPGQARLAALLLLTLRGTPTLYYGDEIGMHDVPIPPHLVQDPFEKNVPGLGFGRDPVRTPMQWDASPHAGFTSAAPWLPLVEDYERVNVEAQRADPDSILSLYRRAIALRRDEPALAVGGYIGRGVRDGVLSYVRSAGERRFLVALNFGTERGDAAGGVVRGKVVLATRLALEGTFVHGPIPLDGGEGVVIHVDEERDD
jgi:alpha-glucosidase